jgi:hypothetical protein
MQNFGVGQISPHTPGHWCPHSNIFSHLKSHGNREHGAPEEIEMLKLSIYDTNKANTERLKKFIPQDKRHLLFPCGQYQSHCSAQEAQGL